MSRELFGTDGVRGIAGAYPLDTPTVIQIGQAVAAYFAKPKEHILVGYDTRESSPHIVAALIAGITAAGVDAHVVGVISTPGLAYLTGYTDAVAGIMVTASHNPYHDNGIKVFNKQGGKLTDSTEAQLNQAILGDHAAKQGSFGAWKLAGDLTRVYEDFLVDSVDTGALQGMRLLLDTAHGAASGFGARVLERVGAVVATIANAPDGRNINAECGATNPQAACAEVLSRNLQGGITLDGDADRVMLIDEQGRLLNGDHILYILAVTGNYSNVVATVMSNLGLENALASKNISLQRTAVGDRYVIEELQQTGGRLGGEQSGHIILPDILSTGDGLLAAIHTLRAVRASGKSLAQWYDEVPMLPQALVNIPADKTRIDTPAVQRFIVEQTAAFQGKGRVLIRPSGTEPLVRVMVEGENAQTLAQAAADTLAPLLAPNAHKESSL